MVVSSETWFLRYLIIPMYTCLSVGVVGARNRLVWLKLRGITHAQITSFFIIVSTRSRCGYNLLAGK